MSEPLFFHIGKALPAENHLVLARVRGPDTALQRIHIHPKKTRPPRRYTANPARNPIAPPSTTRKYTETKIITKPTRYNQAGQGRSGIYRHHVVGTRSMPKPLSLHIGISLSLPRMGKAR